MSRTNNQPSEQRRKWNNHVSYVGRGYVEYRRPDGSTFVLNDHPKNWSPPSVPPPMVFRGPPAKKVHVPLYKRLVRGDEYRIETKNASYDRVKVTNVTSKFLMVTYRKSVDHSAWDGEQRWPGLFDPTDRVHIDPVKIEDITHIYHLKQV
jgi:hypothetical protein